MITLILIGLGLYAFLGLSAFFALIFAHGWGWEMYAFLIPFYTLFPLIVIPWDIWYVPGLAYIIIFPILKLLVGRSQWGKNISKKMNFGSGSSGGGFS